MSVKQLYYAACTTLLALIALCLAWELWLAPIRPGGSWLVLKTLPLLLPLRGLLAGKRYTYQWVCLAVWLYAAEGAVRLSDNGLSAKFAGIEIVLSTLLFVWCSMYARQTAPSRLAVQSGTGS